MTESTMHSVRLSTTFPLLLTTAIGLLATDLYLPAIPIIADALDASVEHAQYTLVAFFAAFSAFQLVYGALAQRFNAGTILALAIALLAIGSLIGALAQSIETLIAARLIQGVGASAGVHRTLRADGREPRRRDHACGHDGRADPHFHRSVAADG